MSSLIPIQIAELAIDNLNKQIYELQQENARIKAAGHSLSLKIHKSQRYADFYPALGDFERLIGASPCTVSHGIDTRPTLGETRRLCEGDGGVGKQEDGRSSNV